MLNQLHTLFTETERPDAESLGASGTEEWQAAHGFLAGKSWQTITVDDFEKFEGLLELVSTFSSKGIQYFIPGLIREGLETEDADLRSAIVSALLQMLTCPCYLEPDVETMIALSELSREQRSFIANAIQKLGGSDSLVCPVLLTSAIKNLQEGRLSRYSQKELEAWSDAWLRKN